MATKLYVGGVAYASTEDTLRDAFAQAGEVDADPFEGRVVVIGASYTGNGDVHDTPLGAMPVDVTGTP